jgi:ABC-type Zn uptake system ZnuABC Zn-binding protein ZnuA
MKAHSNWFRGIIGMAALAAALWGLTGTAWAASKLNVVTTTADLAALTQEVGGDRVNVQSIAKGYQDPHFVEAKPSFLLMLQRADLLISVGLQLEIGWLPPLISQCGNARVQPNASENLDASQFAEILELPTGPVSRAQGDVHPLGNPHYWLDPENGRRVARGIANKLAQLRPEDAQYFEQRYQDFAKRLTEAEKRWDVQMAPYRGRKVVTYHRSWPNFTKRFGLQVMGEIEPRPGIPPSPKHTLELIEMMKREGVKVVLVEPYFDLKTPNAIASSTGAKVVVLLPSVGGEKEASDYFKLYDYDLGLLAQAFQGN